MRVIYFDLGLYTGKELSWMMKRGLPSLPGNPEILAFGVEACKAQFDDCLKRFGTDPRIKLIHVAIGSTEGTVRLYHAENKVGHSIYKSKRNVKADDYEDVRCTKLSTLFEEEGIRPDDFIIVHHNIEGAEWDLLRDIVDTGICKYINVLCGDKPGRDMSKVKELRVELDSYSGMLADNDIKIHYFCAHRRSSKDQIKEVINAAYVKHLERG